MTARRWRGWLWLLWTLLLLPAGCAAPEGSYQGSAFPGAYITDVPPSFYGNNPALEDWFTYPYWRPDAN
jgi:hypothetical protein